MSERFNKCLVSSHVQKYRQVFLYYNAVCYSSWKQNAQKIFQRPRWKKNSIVLKKELKKEKLEEDRGETKLLEYRRPMRDHQIQKSP